MTPNSQHTPSLPWAITSDVNNRKTLIYSPGRFLGIARCSWASVTTEDDLEQAEADAAFIVQACNSHAALVDALKEVLGEMGRWERLYDLDDESRVDLPLPDLTVTEKLRAALKLAEGL